MVSFYAGAYSCIASSKRFSSFLTLRYAATAALFANETTRRSTCTSTSSIPYYAVTVSARIVSYRIVSTRVYRKLYFLPRLWRNIFFSPTTTTNQQLESRALGTSLLLVVGTPTPEPTAGYLIDEAEIFTTHSTLRTL